MLHQAVMAIAQVQISKSYGFVINTHYEQRMSIYIYIYMMHCAIWFHSYSLKNLESTHGGV